MKKKLYSALLATAMIPMAAVAQETTPPAGETPPADSSTTDPTTPPETGTETPPAGETETPPAGGMEMDAPEGTDAPAGETEPMTPETDAAPAGEAEEPAGAMDAPADAMEEDAAGADEADSAASEVEGPFVTVPPTGAWRVTDLEGKNVEDAAGESIGDISDVLVDENGEVIAVLVGVGGFLGIGAKDVAVAMTALEFGPGSMEGLSSAPAADAAAPAGGMAATPDAGAAPTEAAPEPPVVGEDNLPDRIVLNVTREELEAAPAYGEDETDAGGDMGTGGSMGTGGATGGGMAPAPQ